jgi:hypothetical protein
LVQGFMQTVGPFAVGSYGVSNLELVISNRTYGFQTMSKCMSGLYSPLFPAAVLGLGRNEKV